MRCHYKDCDKEAVEWVDFDDGQPSCKFCAICASLVRGIAGNVVREEFHDDDDDDDDYDYDYDYDDKISQCN